MQKIIETIKKHKILSTLVLVSILSIVYLYYYSNQKVNIASIPQPTPGTYLNILNIDPPPGIQESIWTTQSIAFSFKQDIDISSLEYTVIPVIDTIPFLNPNNKTLYIRPKKDWRPNVSYTLTIKKLSALGGGEKLATDIIYQFEIRPPKSIMTY